MAIAPVRLLLDTHALLWWLSDDSALPQSVRRVIARETNHIVVSAATAWEIATKVRLGKLDSATELAHDFIAYLARESFQKTVEKVQRLLERVAGRTGIGLCRGHHYGDLAKQYDRSSARVASSPRHRDTRPA